jgi:hypothetical protein
MLSGVSVSNKATGHMQSQRIFRMRGSLLAQAGLEGWKPIRVIPANELDQVFIRFQFTGIRSDQTFEDFILSCGQIGVRQLLANGEI